MAIRIGALTAGVAGAGLCLLTLGPVVAIALGAGLSAPTGPDWQAVRFTLLQAAVSAGVSALLAVPVARALHRRRFAGRGALIALMGAPFLMPVIVAVMGVLAVFGRGGVVNALMAACGMPPLSIYGPEGVVLAHVFLNLPLATRMVLNGWQGIPVERLRLAESLGLPPWAVFWQIERPMLRATLPGAVLAVMTICLTSFTVALILGGGPRATTVELAIYQALRMDFAPDRAAVLAMLQVVLSGVAALAAARFARSAGFGAGRAAGGPGIRAPQGGARLMDAAALTLAALFLLLPLGFVVWDGLRAWAAVPGSIWLGQILPALMRSLVLALGAGGLAVAGALSLALHAARRPRAWVEVAAMLPMASSGLVIGTGVFLALRGWVAPEAMALPVTLLTNAGLALPFVYRLIAPDARVVQADYGRLAAQMGGPGWARLWWLDLPRLARPLGLGAGLAMALSMGDLGVIALFGDAGHATLPLVVQRLMGAYRMDAASVAALVLMAASFALFALCDGVGRRVAV